METIVVLLQVIAALLIVIGLLVFMWIDERAKTRYWRGAAMQYASRLHEAWDMQNKVLGRLMAEREPPYAEEIDDTDDADWWKHPKDTPE